MLTTKSSSFYSSLLQYLNLASTSLKHYSTSIQLQNFLLWKSITDPGHLILQPEIFLLGKSLLAYRRGKSHPTRVLFKSKDAKDSASTLICQHPRPHHHPWQKWQLIETVFSQRSQLTPLRRDPRHASLKTSRASKYLKFPALSRNDRLQEVRIRKSASLALERVGARFQCTGQNVRAWDKGR